MAEKARENLTEAINLLHSYSDAGFKHVDQLENEIDLYEDHLGTYLVKITARELTEKQNEDVSKFLHTISDFERISDHVDGGKRARRIDSACARPGARAVPSCASAAQSVRIPHDRPSVRERPHAFQRRTGVFKLYEGASDRCFRCAVIRIVRSCVTAMSASMSSRNPGNREIPAAWASRPKTGGIRQVPA